MSAPNDEGSTVRPATPQEQTKTDAAIVNAGDDSRKSFVTLQARFALLGFALHDLSDGSYLACRWNHTRPLTDLHAAATFLRQIGGGAA